MTSTRAGASPRRLDPGVGLTERALTLPDGRRIRAVVAGDDGDAPGPLVVFESGMSAPAACWVHTQRGVSVHARTLSYDRAGYGGSDVDARPRTLERLAEDLAAVLDAAGETAPVVLVGHSWGGPILRCFADRYPERVAGLVFIDATLAVALPPRAARLTARSFQVMALLARIGARGLIRRLTLPHGAAPEISEADLAILWRDYACVDAMRAAGREAAEIASAVPLMAKLEAAGTPDVPTVCLQAGRVDRGMAALRPKLNEAAAELMARAAQGRLVVVDDVGHLIPQECPAVVHAEILEVLEAVAA